MIILDENVRKSQRLLLLNQHVSVRQIGHDIGRVGMQDEEIIPLLHRLHRPTFFTFDFDFNKRNLCHPNYCIVYLAVHPSEGAMYIRSLLRYQLFNTQAKRMGNVIEIASTGLAVWQLHAVQPLKYSWGKPEHK
jgi:hypothetical protein